ncbi:MAG: glycoside hydrolase family 73 protein [Oscillospiraceae bacterium]
MEKLRVTQKAFGTYSHAGSLAIDFGGKDSGIDKLYAPCDIIVKRVRLNATGEVYVESLSPVLFADGSSDYLHAIFIHGDNKRIATGQIFKQGEPFYSEGGWGGGKSNAFANHVHVEAGKGKFNQLIQFKNPQGTYVIENQSPLEKLFILGNDVEIIEGGGYNWKREEGAARAIKETLQSEFLRKIGTLATKDEKESGILACLTIAQAILESGWGNSGLCKISNNLFGIKGEYSGGFVYYPTKEWAGGRYVDITAKFKKYPSWQESLSDHGAMLMRMPQYKNLIGEKDYKIACKKIKADGYATAPDYTPKLINLIEQYELTQYNLPQTQLIERDNI